MKLLSKQNLVILLFLLACSCSMRVQVQGICVRSPQRQVSKAETLICIGAVVGGYAAACHFTSPETKNAIKQKLKP